MPRKPITKPSEQTGSAPVATTKASASPVPAAEEDGLAALLATATGTRHVPLATALLGDASATLGLAKDHPQYNDRTAAMFGLMREFAPRDGVEGSLAAAYAALSTGALQLLARAADPGVPGEHASRLRRDANAALRVSFEALGTLQNLRGRTTRQVLTIERLALGEGAQAIIGAAVDAKPRG